MIGETLEITIVVSMIVLVAYPSAIALRQVMQERRERRVKVVAMREIGDESRINGSSSRVLKQDRV